MRSQKFGYSASVLHMALHTQRQRLNSLQEKKAVKRRQGRAGIPLADGAAPGNKRRIAVMIDVDNTVVGDFRSVKHVVFFGILTPRKLPAIDDHSADTGAASADEFP